MARRALVALFGGVAALCAGVLGGCGDTLAESQRVKLFAGAGLRPAVEPLVEAFRAETGIEVTPDYAGSGVLISRAKETADLDLFMPGDVHYVEKLHEQTGRVVEKTSVSYFVPVIIVHPDRAEQINELKDFFAPGVKAALGNPKACQVGRISGRIFQKDGLDAAALNEPMLSLTVNELGVWVKTRAADASIVWDAIAANLGDSVVVRQIPKEKNIISHVVVGLMAGAPNAGKARRFVEFMTSEKGKAILRAKGYRIEAP
jgi:molybdate transport system substrate-binding protein